MVQKEKEDLKKGMMPKHPSDKKIQAVINQGDVDSRILKEQ
jgi:hypothetical protein